MSRFSAGGLTTAGSTTLPLFSIYGATTSRPFITEIGLFNTTNTAVALKLVRLSTAGTKGASITANALTQEDPAAAIATVFNTHTVAPTVPGDVGPRCVLGAAIGSGVVWTFDDRNLTIEKVATSGIGLIVSSGTGQAIEFYVNWGE